MSALSRALVLGSYGVSIQEVSIQEGLTRPSPFVHSESARGGEEIEDSA